MTSPYIEDAAERARNSRAPAEVIDFATRERRPSQLEQKRTEVERVNSAVFCGISFVSGYYNTMEKTQDALNFLRRVEHYAKQLRGEIEGKT